MIWQYCMKWILSLVHCCVPSAWAPHRAFAQYARDEWLTELLEAYWDLHLNFVLNIWGNHLIHGKIAWVFDRKHFLTLTNPVFLFFILSIFYTNFLKMWTQLSLKLCLKWLIHALLSQSRISWWVFITCQPSNMEYYIVPG